MTTETTSSPSKRDLRAELAAAKTQLAAAQTAAETLAGDDEAALSSDEAYSSLERRKKLAQREIDRCRKGVSDLEVEVDDELSARELAAFERRYAAVKARNLKLRERLAVLRQQIVPEILQLAADLAQDQIDCDGINYLVQSDQKIQNADAAMRSRPAVEAGLVCSKISSVWCFEDGRPANLQHAVEIDDEGRGFMMIYSQGAERPHFLTQKQFRRVERTLFRPARDAVPLWKCLQIPSLDRNDQAVYDGKQAYSPAQAIQMLAEAGRPRGEPGAVTTVKLLPPDGDEKPGTLTNSTIPPPIVEESASTFSQLPTDVRRSE